MHCKQTINILTRNKSARKWHFTHLHKIKSVLEMFAQGHLRHLQSTQGQTHGLPQERTIRS